MPSPYTIDQVKDWSSHNTESRKASVSHDSHTNEKLKLLDNTRIPRLKRDKSDRYKIIGCMLLVTGVIVFAGYSKIMNITKQNEIERLTHFSVLNDDLGQLKIKGIDIANAKYADDFAQQDSIKSLIPLSYIWYVAPKISSFVYNSIIKIEVKCIAKTSIISFRASSQLKIINVVVKAVNKRETLDIHVLDYSYNKNKSIIMFRLNTELISGHEYSVYILFDGQLTTEGNGIILQTYVDGNNRERQMVSAMFQLGSATNLFPYLDDSTHKASFQIILLHRKNFSAISNMPVEKIVTTKHDMVETHFNKSPTTTPKFLFIISEYTYEIVPITGIEVRLYVPKGRDGDTTTAKKMIQSFLQYYQKIFGLQFEIPKLDLVTMQSLDIHASPGLIILSESLLLSNKQTKTLEQIEVSARLLAERLMKQLFGCMTRMESWSNVWFRESMALYLGFELVKYHYPSWGMATQFYLDITNKALVEDGSYFAKPIIPSAGEKVYSGEMKRHALKGAALFDMISQYVGKSTFNKAITVFCTTNQNKQEKSGKAYLEKFIKILEKNITQDDLAEKIEFWFMQPGFPLLTTHHEVGTHGYIVQKNQFRRSKKVANKFSWWIPILARSICNANKHDLSFVVSNETERTVLPECYLYKINSGGHGFYRVHYSKEDARRLIKVLTRKHQVFGAVDRANLLSDAFEITRLYPENITTALDFTTYLNHEHHYVPYKIGLTQLKKIVRLLIGYKKCAKKYIEQKVLPVLDYLNSLQKHDHIQKKLIGLLINEAARFNNDITITLQNMFLHWVMSNSSIHLPSYLREAIFKVGVMDGSIYSWNYMFSYYRSNLPSAEKDLVLRSLVVTRNKMLLKQLMHYSGQCNITSVSCIQEKLKIWTGVCQNENGGRRMVMHAFLTNWKYLSKREGKIFEYLESFMLSCLGSGKSRTDMKQVEMLDDGILPTSLKTLLGRVKESITHHINLISKEHEIQLWFRVNGCQ